LKNKITLISQYIKDLSFENYAAQKNSVPTDNPKINLDIKIKRRKLKQSIIEVTLLVLLEAKHKEQKVFIIELSYAATFSLGDMQNSDKEKRAAFVDCPNILFPFIRQIIFNLTQDSGSTPVSLDYVNFSSLFETKTIT
jgi:preprotein translocase subunit SecB